jgi:hypothetical protein
MWYKGSLTEEPRNLGLSAIVAKSDPPPPPLEADFILNPI